MGLALRLLESLRLRVKDVDFARHELLVRDPKGRRDRVTTLPQTVESELHIHLQGTRLLHQIRSAAGIRIGGVADGARSQVSKCRSRLDLAIILFRVAVRAGEPRQR
jgi:hypothetical protein